MAEQSEHPVEGEGAEVQYEIDEAGFQEYLATLQSEQNLIGGFIGGLAGALIGAAGWALITVLTNTGFALVAIAVGLLAGYGVRIAGKGMEAKFSVMGAILALFGCAVGKLLAIAILVADAEKASIATVILGMVSNPGFVLQVLTETFHPLDVLFYGIAVYEGYQFSLRRISKEEVAQFARPIAGDETPPESGAPDSRS